MLRVLGVEIIWKICQFFLKYTGLNLDIQFFVQIVHNFLEKIRITNLTKVSTKVFRNANPGRCASLVLLALRLAALYQQLQYQIM